MPKKVRWSEILKARDDSGGINRSIIREMIKEDKRLKSTTEDDEQGNRLFTIYRREDSD
jgi:hypothetical protein